MELTLIVTVLLVPEIIGMVLLKILDYKAMKIATEKSPIVRKCIIGYIGIIIICVTLIVISSWLLPNLKIGPNAGLTFFMIIPLPFLLIFMLAIFSFVLIEKKVLKNSEKNDTHIATVLAEKNSIIITFNMIFSWSVSLVATDLGSNSIVKIIIFLCVMVIDAIFLVFIKSKVNKRVVGCEKSS